MLTLGFTLSLRVNFNAYIMVNSNIIRIRWIEQVGYYAAGISLHVYVGMFFNAMATDYFPRLSPLIKIIMPFKKWLTNKQK